MNATIRPRTCWSAGIVVSALLLGGCSGQAAPGSPAGRTASPAGGAGTSRSLPASASPAATQQGPVRLQPTDGATRVAPDAVISVDGGGREVSSLVVKDADGHAVEGKLEAGRLRPVHPLALGTRYTAEATVKADGDATQKVTSTFTTLRPGTVARYVLAPMQERVGVGMPAMVSFNQPIKGKAAKAAVERNMVVRTQPAVEGRWGWLDDQRVMWRPAAYWKPGTKVTVSTRLNGVKIGEDAYVGRDDEETFTIGPSMISKVDMKTHTMSVYQDGKLVRTIPVTTGKPGFTTRSGIKVIMEKVDAMTMNSDSVGIPKGPDAYNIDTKWNMRLTSTGEFLHAAPWSRWAQGRRNVSHGCTNMDTPDAHWLFEHSDVGDVVEFTGNDRPFLDHEGITVWQYPYAEWVKKSALG